MASDVAATLAQIATSTQISSRAVVVDITLRLRADPANSAVVKQLSEQVSGATRKALQDAEDIGQKLVSKANGWAKSIRESMSKGLEQLPAGHGSGSGSVTTRLEQATAARSDTTASARGNDKADGKKERPGAKEHIEAASHLISLLQRLNGATGGDDEATKQWNEKLEAAKNVLEGLGDAVALLAYLKEAASSAKAGLAGVDAAAAGGLLRFGHGGLGKIGGGAGLVITGESAATAALIAGTALAIHDGLKLVLNYTGILGKNLGTMTGAVWGWYESIVKNAELEKQITNIQETRQDQREQLNKQQEATRAHYEARERIDEARKPLHDIANLRATGAFYKDHFSKLGEVDAKTTKGSVELEQHARSAAQRNLEREAYVRKFNTIAREDTEATNAAIATKKRNEADLAKGKKSFKLVVPGEKQNERTSGGGTLDHIGRAYTGFFPGASSMLTGSDDRFLKWITGQRIPLLPPKDLTKPTDSGQPDLRPALPDLQGQLSQQQKMLKLDTELRDMAQARVQQLGSQLSTMQEQALVAKAQVVSAKEQVRVEQGMVNSYKASLSAMSAAEQEKAAQILKKLRTTGTVDRGEIAYLRQRHLDKGRVGARIDEIEATTLSKNLSAELEQNHAFEDLEKAQDELVRSTNAYKSAQQEASQALEEFLLTLQDYDNYSHHVLNSTNAVERTQSKIQGNKDPTEGEGKQPGNAGAKTTTKIDLAGKDFVAAISQMGDAAVNAIKAGTNAARRSAHRINQAQV